MYNKVAQGRLTRICRELLAPPKSFNMLALTQREGVYPLVPIVQVLRQSASIRVGLLWR
jgi:hypothetical protein